MLNRFIALILICTMLFSSAEFAENAGTSPLPKGVTWGMAPDDRPLIPHANFIVQTWEDISILSCDHVPYYGHDTTFINMFLEDSLKAALYDFTPLGSDQFDALASALAADYGECVPGDRRVVWRIMDLFFMGAHEEEDFVKVSCWTTDDSVLCLIDNAETLAVLCVSPDLFEAAVKSLDTP